MRFLGWNLTTKELVEIREILVFLFFHTKASRTIFEEHHS